MWKQQSVSGNKLGKVSADELTKELFQKKLETEKSAGDLMKAMFEKKRGE